MTENIRKFNFIKLKFDRFERYFYEYSRCLGKTFVNIDICEAISPLDKISFSYAHDWIWLITSLLAEKQWTSDERKFGRKDYTLLFSIIKRNTFSLKLFSTINKTKCDSYSKASFCVNVNLFFFLFFFST